MTDIYNPDAPGLTEAQRWIRRQVLAQVAPPKRQSIWHNVWIIAILAALAWMPFVGIVMWGVYQ